MDDDKKQLAMEEWKILQTIVTSKNAEIRRLNSWLAGVLVAIGFASTTELQLPQGWELVQLLFVIFFAFHVAELGVIARRRIAVRRTNYVERCLRENLTYEGPLVSETLQESRKMKVLVKEALYQFGNATSLYPKAIIFSLFVIIYKFVGEI